ncbi:MAG: M48 family metalloprotease, partial [Leifsonia sp.]|uniref:M48 family metalloprotease n=1 Tax=Leifsonia sp. TaxID=1870902 RepID=UPI003F7E80BD
WLIAGPVVVAVALLFAFVSGWLAAASSHTLRNPQLAADAARLERIEHVTGTPVRVEDVSSWTDQANAFTVGFGPSTHVVLWDTLLDGRFSRRQEDVVMAHELGHVRNYDIRLSMIVFGLTVAIGLIADIFLRMTLFGGNNRNNNNGGGNPVVLVFGLVAAIIAPLVATLVQLAVSRQREYLADATGAMTTRHPDALASALLKLQDYSRPMRKQNSSMAHLWIAEPLKPSMMSRLFSTHPPIPERVERLEKMGAGF